MVEAIENPERIARRAKLKYVTDDTPGIIRRRQGRGFRYEYSTGKSISSTSQLDRIEKLAIPPAWSEVWICKVANGHLQVTGKDDAGRKQYLYHERWQEAVSIAKFDHLLDFGKQLSHLRPKVQRAMRKSNPPEKRMHAAMIRILDLTGIRIGNESYAKENGSYGLSTLLGKHLTIHKDSAEFNFPGKSHQQQHVTIEDFKVVRFLKSLKRKPNRPLFSYWHDNKYHSIDAGEVNTLLQELSGCDISAKDFRTWIASARFAKLLADEVSTEDNQKKIVREAINTIADFLGHTPTICQKYYLHPGLSEAFLNDDLSALVKSFRKRRCKWLRPEDRLLIHILEHMSPGKQ